MPFNCDPCLPYYDACALPECFDNLLLDTGYPNEPVIINIKDSQDNWLKIPITTDGAGIATMPFADVLAGWLSPYKGKYKLWLSLASAPNDAVLLPAPDPLLVDYIIFSISKTIANDHAINY